MSHPELVVDNFWKELLVLRFEKFNSVALSYPRLLLASIIVIPIVPSTPFRKAIFDLIFNLGTWHGKHLVPPR